MLHGTQVVPPYLAQDAFRCKKAQNDLLIHIIEMDIGNQLVNPSPYLLVNYNILRFHGIGRLTNAACIQCQFNWYNLLSNRIKLPGSKQKRLVS